MEVNAELFKPFGLSRKTNITLVTMLVILWIVKGFFELLKTVGTSISDLKFFILLIFIGFIIILILYFAIKGRDMQFQLDKKELEKGVKE